MDRDKKCYEEWIDIAKGIAMLAIMYSHIRSGISDGGGYQLYRYLEASFIPVFFFLSGFLYHPGVEISSWKYEVRKRLKRLLIPYLGYSLLLYCIYITWNHSNFKEIEDYLWPLFGIIYSRAGLFYPYYSSGQRYFLLCWNGAFWFITAMSISTLLYFIYLIKCNDTEVKRYIALTICFLISCLFRNIPVLLPWSIDTSFCLVIFMIFGRNISVYKIIDKLKKGYSMVWLLLIVVYIVLVNEAGDINISIRQYGSYGSVSILLYIVLGLLGSLLYSKIAISIQGTIVGRVLSIIGAHTLSMLGLQFLIFFFCDYFADFYNLQIMQLYPFAYSIMKITLSAGLCIVFDNIVCFVNIMLRRSRQSGVA